MSIRGNRIDDGITYGERYAFLSSSGILPSAYRHDTRSHRVPPPFGRGDVGILRNKMGMILN